MVKVESNIEENIHRILLRPNQSTSWKTSLLFVFVIAFTCLAIGIGFAFAGATMILPFAGLEVLFVGVCVYLVMKKTYKQEVITLKTDDLAWSMNQYQRNRLPLTWELIDIKEPEVVLPYDDDEPTLSWVRQTTGL